MAVILQTQKTKKISWITTNMTQKTHFIPRKMLLGAIFLLIVGYSLFQARFIIIGPQITVAYPQDGESVEGNVFTMEGTARNISWISLNDRQIFTDDEGWWSEKLVVREGISTITISARDRFGREVVENIRVVLN